jgi:hypothetical protein
VLLDLAISLALGGDCLADLAQLRAAPEVFGAVASDATVSRCIDALAAIATVGRPPGSGRGRWPASTRPSGG